jgi:hypothetical protein
MELEEWKALVLRAHPEAKFEVEGTGAAKATVGEALEQQLVGTFTEDGVVWFLGKRKS